MCYNTQVIKSYQGTQDRLTPGRIVSTRGLLKRTPTTHDRPPEPVPLSCSLLDLSESHCPSPRFPFTSISNSTRSRGPTLPPRFYSSSFLVRLVLNLSFFLRPICLISPTPPSWIFPMGLLCYKETYPTISISGSW